MLILGYVRLSKSYKGLKAQNKYFQELKMRGFAYEEMCLRERAIKKITDKM